MADARGSTVLGATIGKHRIVRLIGGGTVGRVFVCRLADLASDDDRQVAIKVLRTKYVTVADKLMRDRALVEKIVSPHVAQIFDVAVYNNVPYVVTELVDGESLAALLQKGPLKSADALEVARALCLGLQAAWAQGVAHGDVRPANVLLPHGNVMKAKLTDFMLAPPIEGTESVRGMPAYLAPELLVGTPPDPLSDLYAVGCTLYECLAGKTPFSGGSSAQLHAQVNTPAPSLAATVPGPQGIVDLVDRLLEKDRSKRVKTYGEALAGIERALRGLSMPAPPKPQVPDLDLDIFDDGAEFEDEERTDEIHTSPAREHLEPISEEKPRVVEAPAKPVDDIGMYRSGNTSTALRKPAAPAPAPVPIAVPAVAADIADLQIDASGDHDDVFSIEEPEESTRIDPNILGPAPIPSADDLGLVLEEVPANAPTKVKLVPLPPPPPPMIKKR